MTEESLEGWAPEVGDGISLEEVVERAFDYRGNVTVIKTDGTELEGYLFNRDRAAARPFMQMFDRAGDGPHDIPYSDIRTIHFTGKDTAAGTSYAAWLRAKGASKPASGGA
ncbi:MAG: hypothetical protein AAB387_03885 [candidate division NC10 bacterium]|jgi:hypothetical protein